MVKKLMAGVAVATLASLGAGFAHAQEQVRVGATADYPPFVWTDDRSNLVGFDFDVLRSIAILNNWQLNINDVAFDTLVPSIQNDRLDVLAGLQVNKTRLEVLDASQAYMQITFGLAVTRDSDENLFTTMQDGKKVGAQRGTAQAKWLTEKVAPKVGVSVELYDTTDLIIMDLLNGRLDAMVANAIPLRIYTERQPIRISGTINDLSANFAYLVKKGDEKNLAPRINDGIEKLKSSGAWDNLVAAYFDGNPDNVSKCYQQFGSMLIKDKNIDGYAESMKTCMNQ